METFGKYWWILLIVLLVVLFMELLVRSPNWLRALLRREIYEEQPYVFDWHALADSTRAQPSEYEHLRGSSLRTYDVGFRYLYGDEGLLISYYSRHKNGARTEEIDILQGNGARIVAMFRNGELTDRLWMNDVQTPLTHVDVDLLHATRERMRKRVDF